MNRIVVDPASLTWLQGLTGPTELCDPPGRVLAEVSPGRRTEDERLEPGASREELNRRLRDEEEYSTEEVLAYLEQLGCSG